MRTLREVFATILDVSATQLTKHSSPKSISSWDSVNNLLLISEIEKEYGVTITIEDVYRLTSLGDVFNFIKKHKVPVKF